MVERGVGISVQAIVSNLGIDPSTVTCTLRYSNQLRYAHAQFGLRKGLRFEIARCHEIPVLAIHKGSCACDVHTLKTK